MIGRQKPSAFSKPQSFREPANPNNPVPTVRFVGRGRRRRMGLCVADLVIPAAALDHQPVDVRAVARGTVDLVRLELLGHLHLHETASERHLSAWRGARTRTGTSTSTSTSTRPPAVAIDLTHEDYSHDGKGKQLPGNARSLGCRTYLDGGLVQRPLVPPRGRLHHGRQEGLRVEKAREPRHLRHRQV
eukprot:COSAG05_NODE_64_length_22535_cov_29.681940_2_plen_188_part_00